MTLRTRSQVALGIALALTAIASPASGQRKLESKDVAAAQRCTAIAEKLRTGATPDNARLIVELRDCDESAGALLGALWAVRSHDVEVLSHLIQASAEVRDARIFDALMAAVNDTSRAAGQRAAALTVFASYIDPAVWGSVDTYGGRLSVQIVAHSHGLQPVNGSQPVGDDHRAAINALARRLLETERASDLKCNAALLLQMQKLPAKC